MIVIGADLLASLHESVSIDLKAVFNAQGIIIFRGSEQHRDQKAAGISYEDDSRGNALAAMIRRNHIEVREHQAYSGEGVRDLWARLIADPQLSPLRDCALRYGAKWLNP